MNYARPVTPFATCCPHRKAATATGECQRHLPRTLVVTRPVGPPPRTCPHCHAGPPGWRVGEDFATCVYCGEDWMRPYVVKGA